MSFNVTSTSLDATLNPGTGTQSDRVTVLISYTTSDNSGSSIQIGVKLPTGAITKDIQKAQIDAYRNVAYILGVLQRRVRTKSLG